MTDIPGNQPPPQFDPSQPPPPPIQPVIYPPAKKGTSALKIVLIVVAVFVGLGLIGVALLSYGVYKVAKSSNMTVNTQPVTQADLGVAPYPGATDKANVHMTIAGKDMITATFLTSDSKDQVIAFYQSSLGTTATYTANNNGGTFLLDKSLGDTIVTISQTPNLEGGKTQIVIVHATKEAKSSN